VFVLFDIIFIALGAGTIAGLALYASGLARIWGPPWSRPCSAWPWPSRLAPISSRRFCAPKNS